MPLDKDKPYGNAEWAQLDDLRKAGMLHKTPGSVFLGFHQGRKIFAQGQGALYSEASARSGKLADQIMWNLCGKQAYEGTILMLDPKGEGAKVSQNQKPNYHYNPERLHDLPHTNINPVDHIEGDSASLVSDIKAVYEQFMPHQAGGNSKYFELTAKDIAEAISTSEAEQTGSFNFPRVYDLINQIETGSLEWVNFEYEMTRSKHVFVRRVAKVILNYRKSKSGSTGNGMNGVLAELYLAFSCLNDTVLRESISPPYAFSFASICKKNALPVNFFMMIPDTFLDIWAPIIKTIFQNAMIHKSRAPQAPSQLWIIDEGGQLGCFPLLTKLFTLMAGKNIRTWLFLQSSQQLKKIDNGAEVTIPSCASVQCFFAINTTYSAQIISDLCGQETMEIADKLQQRESLLEAKRLGREILAGYTDRERLENYKIHKQAASHLNKEGAPLILPGQVINKLKNKMIIIASDLDNACLLDRKKYYEAPEMNGYYHPNPYYPPTDSLKLPGKFFRRRIIREKVPRRFANLPQHADGYWSYIEGFRP